jgi:hypothetical protein
MNNSDGYQCLNCGHVFNKEIQKECPVCKKQIPEEWVPIWTPMGWGYINKGGGGGSGHSASSIGSNN